MENNLFVYTKKDTKLAFERFHICTWEFKNDTSMIEIGGEIINDNLDKDKVISLSIHIPWIDGTKHRIIDLYDKLKETENSRFIFNDSVIGNSYFDDGQKKKGVVHNFVGRKPLCVMPMKSEINNDTKTISIEINLEALKNPEKMTKNNVYFRFLIECDVMCLSTRKSGINHSSIIYDFKINEERNLPIDNTIDLQKFKLCAIKACFFFNIIPNSFNLNFFDNTSLKNIRTLEYDSFSKYIGDGRVKKDELVVVFHKKSQNIESGKSSYSFFSIYSKERIGAAQFALAIFANLLIGILLFLANYKDLKQYSYYSSDFWTNLSWEVYFSAVIGISIIIYFIWPKLRRIKG